MRPYRLIALAAFLALAAQRGWAAAAIDPEMRIHNARVLELHQSFRQAAVSDQARLRTQADPILYQRAQKLRQLMQNDPDAAVASALSAEELENLRTDFPDSLAQLEKRGTWRGPTRATIIDHFVSRQAERRIDIQAEEGWLEVRLADNAELEKLKSGDVLEVTGVQMDTTLAAPMGATQLTVASASVGCNPTGPQSALVIITAFPGAPALVDAASMSAEFFGSGRSLDGYWRDASYAKTSVTGAVVGPFVLSQSYTCDQWSAMESAAIAAADASVNFANYNRVFVISPNSSCSYGGISTVGCTVLATHEGNITAAESILVGGYMLPNDQGVEIIAHEAGHGLGLGHSRSRGFSPDALGPVGATGSLSEYGDNFSAMGYYNLGHYSASQTAQLGWQSSTNVKTVQSAGTFSIQPAEVTTTGVQTLKIQRGTANTNSWLWLEYRQPIGNYESTLSAQVFSGVLIHYQDSITVSGGSDLLDFTPADGSWATPALPVGSTWTDPYSDVSLNVLSADASGATVTVNYGPTSNVPNITLSKSANKSIVKAGDIITYTIGYRNTGNAGATTFVINDIIPAQTTLVPGSISAGGTLLGGTIQWNIGAVAAGATGSVNFQVTVQ